MLDDEDERVQAAYYALMDWLSAIESSVTYRADGSLYTGVEAALKAAEEIGNIMGWQRYDNTDADAEQRS